MAAKLDAEDSQSTQDIIHSPPHDAHQRTVCHLAEKQPLGAHREHATRAQGHAPYPRSLSTWFKVFFTQSPAGLNEQGAWLANDAVWNQPSRSPPKRKQIDSRWRQEVSELPSKLRAAIIILVIAYALLQTWTRIEIVWQRYKGSKTRSFRDPRSGNGLWYTSFGSDWYHQYLPIGNGYMGAMISGRPDFDDVVLNLESLWSGGAYDKEIIYNGGNPTTPVTAAQRSAIRDAVWAKQTPNLSPFGSSSQYGSFSSAGSLHISRRLIANATDYNRYLDMDLAMVNATWMEGTNSLKRTYFCSNPAQLCIVDTFSSASMGPTTYFFDTIRTSDIASVSCLDTQTLLYRGQAESGGMTFEIAARLLVPEASGAASCTNTTGNATLTASGTAHTLLLAGGTNYDINAGTVPANFSFAGVDPHAAVMRVLNAGTLAGSSTLLRAHVADYAALYDGFALDLGQVPQAVTTDALLAAYPPNGGTSAGSVYAEWLLFNLGRYMLITGGRGVLPANLQGLWSEGLSTAWSGDYHANINTQMNYWGAEETNLGGLTGPLWDYMEKTWAPRGSLTAQQIYGSRGFVTHNEMNIFGHTGMKTGDSQWANYPASAAWMMLHVWDHFDFTGDVQWFKAQAWPLLKGVAEFWLDNLFDDAATGDGSLVVNPCNSPENYISGPTFGCSHWQQLIWELFNNIEKGFKLAGDTDQTFLADVKAALVKLDRGVRVGSWGQLQEWKLDLDSPTDEHRHISHLTGLYPGYAIASWNGSSPSREEVMDAAAVTLIHRGPGISDSDAGWEKMVRSVLWAQLGNATGAYYEYQLALGRDFSDNMFDMYSGKSTELFQIDANYGAVGAVMNMIVQASNTASFGDTLVVTLLPALPAAWGTGSVRNARVRNGIGLNMTWAGGEVMSAALGFDKIGQRQNVLVRGAGVRTQTIVAAPGTTVRIV